MYIYYCNYIFNSTVPKTQVNSTHHINTFQNTGSCQRYCTETAVLKAEYFDLYKIYRMLSLWNGQNSVQNHKAFFIEFSIAGNSKYIFNTRYLFVEQFPYVLATCLILAFRFIWSDYVLFGAVNVFGEAKTRPVDVASPSGPITICHRIKLASTLRHSLQLFATVRFFRSAWWARKVYIIHRN